MLSVMAKGFFLDSPLIFFPVLALFLFIVVFTAVTVRTLRGSDEQLQHAAGLPLLDDDGGISLTAQKANDHE